MKTDNAIATTYVVSTDRKFSLIKENKPLVIREDEIRYWTFTYDGAKYACVHNQENLSMTIVLYSDIAQLTHQLGCFLIELQPNVNSVLLRDESGGVMLNTSFTPEDSPPCFIEDLPQCLSYDLSIERDLVRPITNENFTLGMIQYLKEGKLRLSRPMERTFDVETSLLRGWDYSTHDPEHTLRILKKNPTPYNLLYTAGSKPRVKALIDDMELVYGNLITNTRLPLTKDEYAIFVLMGYDQMKYNILATDCSVSKELLDALDQIFIEKEKP